MSAPEWRRDRRSRERREYDRWLNSPYGRAAAIRQGPHALIAQLTSSAHPIHRDADVELIVTYVNRISPAIEDVHLIFSFADRRCQPWRAPLPRPLTQEIREALQPLAEEHPVIADLLR